ncbi:sensor histidine kinase [Streptomyces sp. CB01635]|uniref:sensor histidine kinase n=1 Tax=Streptomyces sp. CB01635 TaxID=2020326 RepID=UPI001F18DF57|nr:ATP-binding protein [Streptomyces sp. CB01635]
MSHLRPPAPRADRREGGRHGRPGGRSVPPQPETHIRPQLLRLAVLPPLAVALSASAAVLFTVRSTGARPGLALWAVLAGACLVTLAGIVIAAVAADRAARTVRERVGVLRRASARGQGELRGLVEQLRKGEGPPPRRQPPAPAPDADEFDLLAADMTRAQDVAVTAVVQASQLSSHAGSEQKVEVFVNLARRLQSLVHREISILDELENDVEDPDLLKGLFHVDHLATRIRRHAENLAVLGGAVSRRQWSRPVSMTEVMRSAIAEVEQYSRVKLVPPVDGTLRGHAVADCIHLLAELVENATVFSAPHTQVLLRANTVTSGLAIEVEDRGLGMPVTEQNKMNTLLADPDQVNVASLLQDGRIGLFVVSQLARRHGITVRLQSNIYGGVQAVLVVPQSLLGGDENEPAPRPRSAADATDDSAQTMHQRHQAHERRLSQHQSQQERQHQLERQPQPQSHRRPPQPQPQPQPQNQLHRPPQPDLQPFDPQQYPAPHQPPPPRETPHAGVAVVPRQPQGGASDGGHSGANGVAPPLPLRTAREERRTPADALPGIRSEDRQATGEHTPLQPTPVNGAVRGTMGRPQLPKRRVQEHLAPQLRGGPAQRQERPENEAPVLHDPGLMAAFQRGIGLAEAAEARDLTLGVRDLPQAGPESAGGPATGSLAAYEPDARHDGSDTAG